VSRKVLLWEKLSVMQLGLPMVQLKVLQKATQWELPTVPRWVSRTVWRLG